LPIGNFGTKTSNWGSWLVNAGLLIYTKGIPLDAFGDIILSELKI
jgi:hypothetical protein